MADTESTNEQLRAIQRLATYNERVKRLKRLWIDLEDKEPPVRYAGARRSLSPAPTLTLTKADRAPNLSTGRRRDSSPREQSPAPENSAGRAPSVPRGTRADESPSFSAPRRQGSSPRDRSPAREESSARAKPAPRGRPPAAQETSSRRQPSRGSSKQLAKAKPKAVAPQRPRPAQQQPRGGHDGPLTAAQIQELMSRDLSPEDYELLLLLDEGVVKKSKVLTENCASALPRAIGTDWIDEACPICLCALEEDEDVRMLPTCGHQFHAPCAHHWLTVEKATCPLCGREESKQEKLVGAFRKFDSNGDGMVELRDMREILKRLDDGFWDDARIDRLFRAADVDKDGKLCARDFVNWLCCGQSVASDAPPPSPPDLSRDVTRDRVRQMVEAGN